MNNQGGKGWDFKLSELLSGTLAREQDRSQQIGPVGLGPLLSTVRAYRTATKRSYRKRTVTRYCTVFLFVQNLGTCFTLSNSVPCLFFGTELLKLTN